MAISGGTAESAESAELAESAESAGSVNVRFGVDARPRRPIGVSPQIASVAAGGTTWWPGDKWPPDHTGATWGQMSAATPFMQPLPGAGPGAGPTYFPQRVWGPNYWSNVILADFVAYAPGGGGVPLPWNQIVLPAFPAPGPELAELVQLIPYRPSVQTEILSQKDAILQYFSGILSFELRTHPATVYLCAAALSIGAFQATYYKNNFNRVRPSRLRPEIMPLVDPPGHASYPSGHATQSRLIALCLERVMPAAIIATQPAPVLTADQLAELSPLRMMANRIARNREVAGLHYPSDSVAGKTLANGSFSIMLQLNKVQDLITAAQLEWAPL